MKVLTIEQMHQLKELGVDVKPKSMCIMYTSDSSDNYYLKYGESTCEDDIKAFSLEDVFDLLPKEIIIKKVSYQLNWNPLNGSLRYDNMYGDEGTTLYGCCYIEEEGILYASYNILVWVIENGYLNKVVYEI